jgi:hypothetical protein
MLAAEYGWSLEQILNLTMGQLNLLIVTIGERKNKDYINSAIVMRLAVVAALSKEGAEAFQELVHRTFDKNVIVPVGPEDLAKFGLKEM